MKRILVSRLGRAFGDIWYWGAIAATVASCLFMRYARMADAPPGDVFAALACGGWMLTPLALGAYLISNFNEELRGRHASELLTFGATRGELAASYLTVCAALIAVCAVLTVLPVALACGVGVAAAVRAVVLRFALLCAAAFLNMCAMPFLGNAAVIPPAVTMLTWQYIERWAVENPVLCLAGTGYAQPVLVSAAVIAGAAALFAVILERVELK